MATDEHDNGRCGETRTARIAPQAQDAGEAAAQRALTARWRGRAAGKRVAELRAWSERSPFRSREAADRAADAAEREGDMTRAIEHQRAAARDRTAASDDRSRSQQTAGSVYDAGD